MGLGVASLYATWRSTLPRYGRVLGWATIAMGTAAWSFATGADRGIAMALIVLCISALCWIAVSAFVAFAPPRNQKQTPTQKDKRPIKVRDSQQPRSASQHHSNGMVGRRIGWFLAAGPGAALLAFTTALASHQMLLGADVLPENALVTELFLFPVLWGFLAVWSLLAENLWRRMTTMALLQFAVSLAWYAIAS